MAWQQNLASAQLEASLDNDRYDPDQLILLRVSADALPYSNSSEKFERAEGAIEIGLARYQYVKKRLYHDSIEFLCIPDRAATRIQKEKNEFFSLVNDLQKASQDHLPGSSAKMIAGLYKIVYWQDFNFPRLQLFPAAPVTPEIQKCTALMAGHPRIGKQPPRSQPPIQDLFLS